MSMPPNKGMNPTKSSQTDWGLRGLFQCSTGTRTGSLILLALLLGTLAMPAGAITCMPFTYHLVVELPRGPGWTFSATAVPERRALKVWQEKQGDTLLVKVVFPSDQPATKTTKFDCSWEPKAFLLSAQRDETILEYRVQIPSDVERVAGTTRLFRSKTAIVMLAPSEARP